MSNSPKRDKDGVIDGMIRMGSLMFFQTDLITVTLLIRISSNGGLIQLGSLMEKIASMCLKKMN